MQITYGLVQVGLFRLEQNLMGLLMVLLIGMTTIMERFVNFVLHELCMMEYYGIPVARDAIVLAHRTIGFLLSVSTYVYKRMCT